MPEIMMFLKKIYQSDRLLGWCILLVALIPRVIPSSGVYLNVDAAGHWITRTKTFLLGLTSGNVGMLAPSGHPGVPLMWLTSIGEVFLQHTQAYRWFTDPIVGYLTILKLPVIIATAVLATLVWWIGRKVLPRPLAAGLALLLALDPLFLAFSRYLQLDALLTGFITLGVIAWWGALQKQDRRWAFWAGVGMALAVLTRLNAAVGFMFVLLTWCFMTNRRNWRLLAAFAIGAIITSLVVWPMLIRHPVIAVHALAWGVQLGFTTHELISSDLVPGWIRPMYFPLFLLTRISTLELVLFVTGLVAVVRNRKSVSARPIIYFLSWSILVVAALLFSRKQIDRYALPAVLGLMAVCIYGFQTIIWPWMQRRLWWKFIGIGIVAWQLIAIGRLQPYFQTYRNFLGELLVRTPVQASSALWPDWGEGMREANNELHRRTGAWPSVASWFPAILCVYGKDFDPHQFPFDPKASLKCDQDEMFFSPRAQEAEYIFISRDQLHQSYYPVNEIALLKWDPEFIIELNNHPYVWVYRNQGNLPPRPR